MEQVFANGLHFSIEFIKLLLAMVYIWRVKPKKNISYAFVVGLFIVMVLSGFVALSQITFVYAIIIVLIFTFCTYGKNRTALSILTYIFISLLDMFWANLVISVFQLSYKQMNSRLYFAIACNSINLIILFIYTVIYGRKVISKPKVSRVLLPIYIIGGLALSLFATGLQIAELDKNNRSHHDAVFVGLILAAVYFVVVCVILEHDRKENERLYYVNEMNSRLMKTQSSYYLRLLQKEKETKAFRHDIKAQFMCMRMLYENEEYDKLGIYINDIQTTISKLSANIDTGNDYVNVIVADLDSQYPEVELEWQGVVPATILSYMDICTLFYNVLKNAYEAAAGTKEKSVKAIVKVQQQSMIISVSNNYNNVIGDDKNGFRTTKEQEGHGYGIGNIKRCVEKYHGEYNVLLKDNIFKTDIVLLNVVDNETKERTVKFRERTVL